MANFIDEYVGVDRTTVYHAFGTVVKLMDNAKPPKHLVECLGVAIECYNKAIKEFNEKEYENEYDIKLMTFRKRLDVLCQDSGLEDDDIRNILSEKAQQSNN